MEEQTHRKFKFVKDNFSVLELVRIHFRCKFKSYQRIVSEKNLLLKKNSQRCGMLNTSIVWFAWPTICLLMAERL